ncbi:hypothetical protein PUN28_005997 [Cardiocondyla obscurior]|uniref:Uncharacterized protein n=1 Tax=Cardiocondyla obscurior TaxID=286306 RepID=A0AAW2G872_9HYME
MRYTFSRSFFISASKYIYKNIYINIYSNYKKRCTNYLIKHTDLLNEMYFSAIAYYVLFCVLTFCYMHVCFLIGKENKFVQRGSSIIMRTIAMEGKKKTA